MFTQAIICSLCPDHALVWGTSSQTAGQRPMRCWWCSRSSTKSIIFPYNIWCVCVSVCVIIDPNSEKSSIWSTRPILIGTVFCLLFKLWANLTQKACNHLLYSTQGNSWLIPERLLPHARKAPTARTDVNRALMVTHRRAKAQHQNQTLMTPA